MTAVQSAEKAIERLKPGEFEQFLVWLSGRVAERLGAESVPGRTSAQARMQAQEAAVQAGEAEPFRYVDLDRLPEAAQKKAEGIIAEWRARYGS